MSSVFDNYYYHAATAFAKQIDKEIMANVHSKDLANRGWIKSSISMKTFMAKPNWILDEVTAWIQQNIDGEYSILDNYEIWFKEERHASMFALRWA